MYYIQKKHGFTLVELITVIFVVGLLSVVAIPRFINVQDRADLAAIEGVAGGLASGVTLVRAQWEVLGKPGFVLNEEAVQIEYGLVKVGVDPFSGYPTTGSKSNPTSTKATDITVEDCEDIFQTVLHNAPSITKNWTQEDLRANRFYVFKEEDAGSNNICTYSSTRAIREIPYSDEASLIDATKNAHRIVYKPATGDVKLIRED